MVWWSIKVGWMFVNTGLWGDVVREVGVLEVMVIYRNVCLKVIFITV